MAGDELVRIASGVLDYPDLATTDRMIMELRGSTDPEDQKILDGLLEYRFSLTA